MFHDDTTTILLISGYIGSGKDVAAEILCEEMMFKRLAFADALKESTAEKTGLPLELFYSRSTKDSPLPRRSLAYPTAKTYRDLLLLHGLNERAKNPDIFAQIVGEKIKEEGTRIVISDWRYRNEYEYLRSTLDGNAYRIVRCRITRPGVEPIADPSEHELDEEPMDFIVDNTGTLSDLSSRLKKEVRAVIYPDNAASSYLLSPN